MCMFNALENAISFFVLQGALAAVAVSLWNLFQVSAEESNAQREQEVDGPPTTDHVEISQAKKSTHSFEAFHPAAAPTIVTSVATSYLSLVNPTTDWAESTFSAPHQAIRREMCAMSASIDKILLGTCESWQVVFFCEWIIEWFAAAIRDHHDNEEKIYFPFIASKAGMLPKHHHDELYDSHDLINSQLDNVCLLCEQIIKDEGKNSFKELLDLQDRIHEFNDSVYDHLLEEEATMPPIVRSHFTPEEMAPIMAQIYTRGGVEGQLRVLLPSIVLVAEEWATSSSVAGTLLLPLEESFTRVVMPDHLNYVVPKRDAPFLGNKPTLERVAKVA